MLSVMVSINTAGTLRLFIRSKATSKSDWADVWSPAEASSCEELGTRWTQPYTVFEGSFLTPFHREYVNMDELIVLAICLIAVESLWQVYIGHLTAIPTTYCSY